MLIKVAAAALALFLGGCAVKPQMPVMLDKQTLGTQAGRVGVMMTALPKADMFLPGADCLLCYAVASASNATLSKYASTLPNDDVAQLKNQLAQRLRAKGTDAVVIEEELNLDALPSRTEESVNGAKKDFSQLRQKYNVDRLLVVGIERMGIERYYSGYISNGDPKGVFRGAGYLVNLKTNTYEWYEPISILRAADGQWDEPPKFPGLTNAYFQAMETGKDLLLKPLQD